MIILPDGMRKFFPEMTGPALVDCNGIAGKQAAENNFQKKPII